MLQLTINCAVGSGMLSTGVHSVILAQDEIEKIRAAISKSPVRPFLAIMNESAGSSVGLCVHIARQAALASDPKIGSCTRQVRGHLSSALGGLFASRINFKIRVKVHSDAALDRPRSLEAFVSAFGRGERLYDPTGVFAEADRLAGFARALRHRLPAGLQGVYWSSRLRTVYVQLREGSFAEGFFLLRDRLAAAEQAVIRAFEAGAGSNPGHRTPSGVSHSVRLCFELPAIPLVPADAASEMAQQIRGFNLSGLQELATLARVPVLGALLGIGTAATAAANASPIENAQISIGAGKSEAVPGVAIRDLAGTAVYSSDGATQEGHQNGIFPGGGLHMLWRDPVRGTIGRNASYDGGQSAPETPGPKAIAGTDGEQRVSREHFAQVSRSGASFGAHDRPAAHQGGLDLAWLTGSTPSEAGEQSRRRLSPRALQAGIAAIPGLTSLAGNDLSDEAYDTILQHLLVLFGSPRSLQGEARRHVSSPAVSSAPSRQNRDVFGRRLLLADADSYWDWLQRRPGQDRGYDRRRDDGYDRGNRDYRPRPSSF